MEKTMEATTLGLGFGRNGKQNGNYYRDYCKDPFLRSWLTEGQLRA